MRSIIILMFCVTIQPIWSQDGLSVQVSWLAGRIVSHNQLYAKPKALQQAFTLDINKKTDGKRFWQAIHNYPQMGLNIAFRKFNNNPSLGNAFNLIPYLEFNLLKSHAGTLQIKHGTGLAFVTRIHNAIKNPENLSLSTHLNAGSLLDVGYHFDATTKWDIKTGMAISHISNGNFKVPNSGVNTMFVYTSIIYFFNNKKIATITYAKDTIVKRLYYRCGIATGFYDYNKALNKIRTDDQFHFLIFYQHNTRFRTGAGLEVSNLRRAIQPAIYIEEEVLFAHLVTRYGIGSYLANVGFERNKFYEKVGIAYYPFTLHNKVAHGFSIGANIKAHSFDALHIELAAAYVF